MGFINDWKKQRAFVAQKKAKEREILAAQYEEEHAEELAKKKENPSTWSKIKEAQKNPVVRTVEAVGLAALGCGAVTAGVKRHKARKSDEQLETVEGEEWLLDGETIADPAYSDGVNETSDAGYEIIGSGPVPYGEAVTETIE